MLRTRPLLSIKMFFLLLIFMFTSIPASTAVYTYDSLNRLTSVTYKNGQKIVYTYDPGGNMLTIDSHDADTPPTVKTTDPTDGATGVSVSASVYVTFSESVVEDVYFSDINIKNIADSSVVESTYSLSGNLLTIDPFNDLDYSVTYAVYIPAGAVKDTGGNSLANTYSFSFTTIAAQDATPPDFASTYPKAVNTDYDSFDLLVQTNENGKAYYVLLDDGAPAPTSAEVRAGTASGGGSTLQSGYIDVTANIEAAAIISGFAASTDYDIYVVAEDTVPNLQETPVKVDVSTTAAPDTTPPAVISSDPANDEIGVAIDKVITVVFSEAIQQGNYFNEINLSLGGVTVPSVISINSNNLTIDPDANLNYSANYSVTAPAGSVKDLAGNDLAGTYNFSFTTCDIPDTTPPTVSARPAGGLYNTPQSVTLTASEPAVIYYTTDGSDPITSSTQYTEAISVNATTTLKFMAVDQANNQSVIYTETYTIDTVSPTISSTDPANGSTNVPLNKVITVTLSENIQPGSLYGDITLKDSGNNTVAITKSINNNLLTITPNANLTKNTQYTVTIPAGAVSDMAGNVLLNNYTFVFTTVKK